MIQASQQSPCLCIPADECRGGDPLLAIGYAQTISHRTRLITFSQNHFEEPEKVWELEFRRPRDKSPESAKLTTRSEALFDLYCEHRQYDCQVIPETTTKTPDRLVRTPHGEVVVEIKELTPNREDKKRIKAMAQGNPIVGASKPGRRVSKLIRKAAAQLKPYADSGNPTILVIYDAIEVDQRRLRSWSLHLEAASMDFGMYGLQAVRLSRQEGKLVQTSELRAGDRRLTKDQRTYISAVAELRENGRSAGPTLSVYHNFFARVPLSQWAFRGTDDRHYCKPGNPDLHPQKWEEIE